MSGYLYFNSNTFYQPELKTPGDRGRWRNIPGTLYCRQFLPTDSLGNFTLRLKNIVRGSRYRVEIASTGALVTGGEGDVPAGTGTTIDVDLTLPYYAVGNANNELRVKVRKGSAATKYLPFETQAVAQAGTVISYIGQVADPIA